MQRIRQAAAIVLATCGIAAAQTPATRPTTQPSGADLVRTMRGQAAWLHTSRSIDLQWEGRIFHSPESIRVRREALKRQFPDREPDAAKDASLRPETTTASRIAFDDHRVLFADEWAGEMRRRATWDGRLAISRTEYLNFNQDDGSIARTIGRTFESAISGLQWNPTAFHPLWWVPPYDPQIPVLLQEPDDPPEQFVVMSRTTFRGIECWLVEEKGYNSLRLFFSIQDGRLRGSTFADRLPDEDPRAIAAAVRVAAARGGKVASVAEFKTWLEKLSKPDNEEAWQAFRFEVDSASPDGVILRWCDDWREVKPGCWLPMREGYRFTDTDPASKQRYEALVTERHVTAVRIDEPLDDSLFTQTLPDGVRMVDLRYDPPLSYRQKANRTPAEWDELVAQAKKSEEAEKAWQAAMKRMDGKPALSFGDRRWLNVPEGATPPTWESLKGKIVLLDFSAEWCGPCANDWPTLAELHKDADKIGIAVVALHPPGSSDAKMRKMIDDYKLAYPICVDTEAKADAPGMGELFEAYGVRAIPTVFVIDRDGKVAGHGFLGKMLPLARSLAAKK